MGRITRTLGDDLACLRNLQNTHIHVKITTKMNISMSKYISGNTPLDVKRMRQVGIMDVNVQDKDKCTLLHRACCTRPLKVPKLLEMGADPNIQNCHGYTPLIHACIYHPSLVEYLVERGADVNVQTMDGLFLLDYACMWDRSEKVIRCLYERTLTYPRKSSINLRKVVAFYASLCWKRSEVGCLSSRILTTYL
jgi:hypothetical protein